MKRCGFFAACLFLILAAPAWAGQYGPITSQVDSGQFYLGGGFGWASVELDTGDFTDGNMDATQGSIFAEGGIGFGSGWKAYLRAGGADFTLEDAYQFLDDDEDSDDLRPFVTAGLGGPVFVGNNLTVGPFVQLSYFSDYETSRDGAFSSSQGVFAGEEEIFFDNAFAGDFGVTFEVSFEGATLYGGPIYSFYSSEIESVFTANNGQDIAVTDDDIKLDAPFGGFIGISWPLTNNLLLDLEGQYQSGGVLGGKLLYVF